MKIRFGKVVFIDSNSEKLITKNLMTFIYIFLLTYLLIKLISII